MRKIILFALLSFGFAICSYCKPPNNDPTHQTTGNKSFGGWNLPGNWRNNNPAPVEGEGTFHVRINSTDTILLNRVLGPLKNNFVLDIEQHAYLKISGNFLVQNNLKINVATGATFIIEGNLVMQNNADIFLYGQMQVNDIVGNNGNSIQGNGDLHVIGEVSGISVGGSVNQSGDPIEDPLPVELLTFSGKPEANQVVLEWSTASEINNMGFEIQRLDEASQNWNAIGFVDGNYNTNFITEYSFIDAFPEEGANFYRLKQMDYDGKYHYYGPVAVVCELFNSGSFDIVSSEGTHRIIVNEKDCRIEVFDLSGNLVESCEGKNIFEFPAPGQPLIIRVLNEKEVYPSRLIL